MGHLMLLDRLQNARHVEYVALLEVDLVGNIADQAVVAMARELGLTVVAEGVETPLELATVAAARCAVVQGYFYSPPVSLERLDALLTSRFPEN